ncbi:MAG: carboxymuconolactone decarboxylase family protein, partial [Acidimicrobiia bacterium]|nr:carboxymuconolactone decarboxylase family protein [Acidimicrobiia bacterium]
GPRIPPLPASERDEQAQELLGGVGGLTGPASNIFDTLVRHPGLFRKWMPFGGKLLTGKLPARDRELLILRTGWNCRSDYEWGQHVLIARSVGLNDEEIARVVQGPAAGWEEFDRALLTAADELHEQSRVSDPTWTVLAGRYDEKQLIELVMLVGHYHMVAFTLNTLGVEREAGVPGLPEGA